MELLTTHQQNALNFKDHISLTANAGSGKTFVLSRRYLEIALSLNGSIGQIAAITFTDKAASELYKKIAEYIESRYENSSDAEEKRQLNHIRRQLVSANISTIHSFCIDILRQFPVEAGLDANFQSIDEVTSDELIELSIEEVLREALSGSSTADDARYLVRFFRSRLILATQLQSLVKQRKKVQDLRGRIYSGSPDEIRVFFHEAFLKTAGILIQIGEKEFIDSLNLINDTVLSAKDNNERALEIRQLIVRFREAADIEDKIGIFELIRSQGFTGRGEIRKQGYLANGIRDGLTNRIAEVEKYVCDISKLKFSENYEQSELSLARFGKSVINLFGLCVEKYESKKRENGYLDYEDILILTRNLLKNPSVKAELSRKFRYVMVDEYQDTNEIQYQIFLPILDDLKEGNLFVVGDEKQSIYMFRDADLEVFRITKDQISDASGEQSLLSLPDSFRMAPGICLFVNKLFRNLFSDPNNLFNEVNHSDLVCAKKEDTDSLIEIIIGAKAGEEENTEAEEAELAARRIISLVKDGTGLNWKDIAVLVRKRKSFSSLEQKFIEKNIPFNIVGGKGFYQRQAVYDIYNYFSFLLDPRNDTALVGILRSPFFNVPDNRIYELSLYDGRMLWEKLLKACSTHKELLKICDKLKIYLEQARVFNAPRLLRRILSESPYLAVLSQKASGQQEIANIDKLVKLTIGFQGKGFKTMYDYVNFLKNSIEEMEDEAQAAIADESDSVKVMTLHQAKGLEYPAVFIYNAHETTSVDRVKKGSIQVDKNYGLLTKVPANDDYFSEYESAPISSLFDYVAAKKETAELKRLFYVGATRAKNYLFISAEESENYKAGSFMGLLQEGLQIDFTQDKFEFTDELQFLNIEGDKFDNFSKEIVKEIKITRSLDETDNRPVIDAVSGEAVKIMVDKTENDTKGEVISATQFAVFSQCPMKYRLTFELEMSELMKDYAKSFYDTKIKKSGLELNPKEDSSEEAFGGKRIISAERRGSIIHKILQEGNLKLTTEEIESAISNEFYSDDPEDIASLSREISDKLSELFKSSVFKNFSGYKKSFNEYEIYVNEEDYYLHGIIDKLIIDQEKAIIVDYKTDSISREEICDRASLYFHQLKFYSYIVSRFFKQLTSFELRLIFVNFPGEDVKEIINLDQAEAVGEQIREMVHQIRLNEFDKNLSHCKDCNFVLNNSNCMVGRA